MKLPAIERKIAELHGRLCLRPTLERAREIGLLLIRAKPLVPYGEWLGWLRRVGLGPRISQLYVEVARAPEEETKRVSHLTINQFLFMLRQARKATVRTERAEARRVGMREYGPGAYRVHTADCRRFRWPASVDAIVTDPPWKDMDAYRWLGGFARKHLRPGGLVIVQCGNIDIPCVLGHMKGLEYRWTLAIVLQGALDTISFGPFAPAWRPVLVFSKGRGKVAGFNLSDVYSVRSNHPFEKVCHDWQQPLQPFVYWLHALTKPGQLVADPFAGSGTIGVALKMLGARRYIATEVEKDTAAIARGRLADTKEGSG